MLVTCCGAPCYACTSPCFAKFCLNSDNSGQGQSCRGCVNFISGSGPGAKFHTLPQREKSTKKYTENEFWVLVVCFFDLGSPFWEFQGFHRKLQIEISIVVVLTQRSLDSRPDSVAGTWFAGTKDRDQGQGPGSRTNQDQGPGTRGPGDQGPETRDQGPRTKDQGPRTRDQGPGSV